MRHWVLLLLMATLAYSQFYSPPINDVMANNLGRGYALENGYDGGNAVNSTVILLSAAPAVPVSGSVNVAGMSLMLDNGTYPEDGLAVLVARGSTQGHLRSSTRGSTCNYSSHASGCDFDNDGCAEYENFTSVVYAYNVTFRFGNLSVVLSYNGTAVVVPQSVFNAMKNSSGAEQLNVSINCTIKFVYDLNDPGNPGCNDHYYYINRSISFSTSRNFTVFGVNKLYFLRAPVLREQWFRDNRFDTIILSQSPLYHAGIWFNGNLTRNLTLRTFSITTGQYGIQTMVSNLTSPDGWSERINLTTPILLESYPHSFAYAYEFNYSYEGLGRNNLSITVNDSFLGSARYDESLLSRMLSYNGASTENGSPASSVPSRPSAVFSPDSMSSFKLALGFLALLFILSFVNVWLLK
jgi:hypothetical protein